VVEGRNLRGQSVVLLSHGVEALGKVQMISSGESSTSVFGTLPRPDPPPQIQSSPRLTEGMSPLEYPRPRPFVGLRIDTSGSNSPASSKTVSPAHESGRLARASSLKRRQTATEAKKYLSRYRLGESFEVKDINADVRGTATPPVDVPAPPPSGPGENGEDDGRSTSDSEGIRSTSITFSPTDTLDSGKKVPANSSLPKSGRSRGRSMMDELESSISAQPLVRSHSESERTNFDPYTGERRPGHRAVPNNHRQYHAGEGRHPLLQSTVDELATGEPTLRGKAPRSTADSMDFMLSPVSASSPYQPTSLEDTSAWPPSRRSIGPRRIRSYEPRRQRSRGISRRSSISISPASAYLYGSLGSATAAEPDDEGQEVGEYTLGKQIGRGGFSIIREAYTTEHDQKLTRAVKIVRKRVREKGEQDNEKLQMELEHEVDIWRGLGHEHILPLISVYVTSCATFCFTELYSSGTLFDLIRAKRRSKIMGLPGDIALRYAYQLASAIRYLHKDMHVVHRDIKLENCLLDMSVPDADIAGGRILLCDFGMAEYLSDDGRQHVRRSEPEGLDDWTDRVHQRNIGPSDTSTSIVGSLQYASPEMIDAPAGLFSPAVDIWTFGVVVYALFVGSLPFHDTFQPRIVMAILAGEWNEDLLRQAHGIAGMEEDAFELIRGCLEMDPDVRWDITQVMACNWFEGYESKGAMSGGGW
jgi:serine/threonine protein kinase